LSVTSANNALTSTPGGLSSGRDGLGAHAVLVVPLRPKESAIPE
jgi:hypothetical protein